MNLQKNYCFFDKKCKKMQKNAFFYYFFIEYIIFGSTVKEEYDMCIMPPPGCTGFPSLFPGTAFFMSFLHRYCKNNKI